MAHMGSIRPARLTWTKKSGPRCIFFFCVHLPPPRLIYPHVKRPPSNRPPPEDRPATQALVLVIDDEELIRASLARLLWLLGCWVHVAHGVDDAAALCERHDYDLVVTDLELGRSGGDGGGGGNGSEREDMPEGLRFAEQLLIERPTQRLAFLSAQQRPDVFRQAVMLGHYLEKGHPSAFERLKTIVEDVREERAKRMRANNGG